MNDKKTGDARALRRMDEAFQWSPRWKVMTPAEKADALFLAFPMLSECISQAQLTQEFRFIAGPQQRSRGR